CIFYIAPITPPQLNIKRLTQISVMVFLPSKRGTRENTLLGVDGTIYIKAVFRIRVRALILKIKAKND
ncbi:MAG: hypothetical protein ACE5IE_07090, partial [Dehalococcoidia bacterium]